MNTVVRVLPPGRLLSARSCSAFDRDWGSGYTVFSVILGTLSVRDRLRARALPPTLAQNRDQVIERPTMSPSGPFATCRPIPLTIAFEDKAGIATPTSIRADFMNTRHRSTKRKSPSFKLGLG